ncbi:MAG: type I methionyl aminopeptidase [Candidatus Brennerbacteria bacterium RIFOXYC1_FULL_41_11]|uniref:Methionine aminopeptidase n=1 Tax=Candidatus Brennerbacteria bacterium RIFOXYD1_FULL_41_16 TaxID=1797529 RepID=A0A1G1XKM2_9BACT|nr:MAG: type I methionyl aminopeptidase [Candidatus Brennerbacteria bacterium RIFOXYB1_FULL_41_13]OGY39063.1 MAG: type I methionyl aminopeptidase [Candidatus Brennerbacteria bacterium RIFOXYC1_FULL_41_11]OGY40216.1 MAG: type I methionyl aminopeptidase [Candidatus Brennerbacteria bacterium RIFOXYD1_FULL_41_16]
MAITIKTEKEIELLKAGGKRLALILDELAKMCITGVSGDELDKRAGYLMEKYSSRSAFFRYRPAPDSKPFPANICLSVNHVAVHGIPSKKIILREGDVVKVDAGLIYGGMIVDSAVTVVVGNTTAKVRRLIKTTKKALDQAIKQCLPGKTIGDIGFVVEATAKKNGVFVVKDLAGHGVGYDVHEDPFVMNFGRKNSGEKLRSGMVLALEPILSLGSSESVELEDGSIATIDGSISAQFEHTVVITENKPLVVTRLD